MQTQHMEMNSHHKSEEWVMTHEASWGLGYPWHGKYSTWVRRKNCDYCELSVSFGRPIYLFLKKVLNEQEIMWVFHDSIIANIRWFTFDRVNPILHNI